MRQKMNNKSLQKLLINTVVLAGLIVSFAVQADDQVDNYILDDDVDISHIVIKYNEGAGIRFRNGVLLSDHSKALPSDLSVSGIVSDIESINSIVEENNLFMMPTFTSFSEEELDEMHQLGTAKSNTGLSNLNLYHSLYSSGPRKYSDVEEVLELIRELEIVKLVYAQPIAKHSFIPIPGQETPPPDYDPYSPTPDFQPDQRYLGAAPNGVEAEYAWTKTGGKGENVKIVDVEISWHHNHEDLPTFFYNNDLFENGYVENDSQLEEVKNHGTSVVGIISALDGNKGVTGIANRASIGVESVRMHGFTLENRRFRYADAILGAAQQVGSGGIVLVELQAKGPRETVLPNISFASLVPVEYYDAVFSVIQTVTNTMDVIVVEAAGNGGRNLDSELYNGRFDRHNWDSGAIIVGSSESDQRSPLLESNYGSRVDVHAWGEYITTTGNGDLFNGSSFVTLPFCPSCSPVREYDRMYTKSFGGTSGASAMVAGAAAVLQGIAKNLGVQIEPEEMRELLATTSTAQTSQFERNIGGLPNLKSAIDHLEQAF